jgi:hypothetical protein
MTKSQDIKVMLCNAKGNYLAGDPKKWGFVQDRARAIVFDYFGDQIAEQIERIESKHGLTLRAVPANPDEIHETCDCCHRLLLPFKVFFDGAKFLCPECKDAAGKP